MKHTVKVLGLALWVGVLFFMAGVLVRYASWFPPVFHRLAAAEPFHVFAHLCLYGTLAALLAEVVLAPVPLDTEDTRARLGRRALASSLLFGAIAAAQEGVQVAARHRGPTVEEGYDLVVDVVAGALGVIAWTACRKAHRVRVARALGWVLHPAWVAPGGLFGAYAAALRALPEALRWTALALACVLPAVAAWGLSVRRGWVSSAELARREERGPFLALVVLGALAHLGLAWALGAPAAVRAAAALGALGSVALAAITRAGLKVSGHVALPVALAVALGAASLRLPVVFALVAVALSWARVCAAVHAPREVAAGWALGAGACVVYLLG